MERCIEGGIYMRIKRENVDMLHGPLAGKILLFTIPIALSSMLQQLFNAADTAVVGLFENANALAAVGTNTEIVALIVSVSTGLAVGTNLLIANRMGQNKVDQIPEAVQTAILLALIIGVPGCVLGQVICKPLLVLMQTPADILNEAVLYLRIYLVAYPFLLLYDFASAILRARGNSHDPFIALVLSGIVNVWLNLLFVALFHMGVAGVAVATALSTVLSAALTLWSLARDIPFFFRPLRILKTAATEILKVGIPAAIQGAVFCFANIFVQVSVNSFGAAAIAGSAIAMNFEYFTYYIITAFGQTATTFTGQNYAAGQQERCKRILRLCLGLSTICSSVPIFSIVLFRTFFSGLFTSDVAVIESAATRIVYILTFEPLCNFYEIPAGCLRGRGHSVYPAAATMIGTCFVRVVWVFTAVQRVHTLPMLYQVFPLSWVMTILILSVMFMINAKQSV